MATLSLIGEQFPDAEQAINQAASLDLALQLAETAPRGCGVELVIGRTSAEPALNHPKLSVHRLALPAATLPAMWQSGVIGRSFDGAMVHSLTALAPLRARDDGDSQVTVTVPHTLAWDAPESMPGQSARFMRAFTRRAVRHADQIVVPTHAVAEVLRGVYGPHLSVRVIPLAAPSAYLAGEDAAERRLALGVPGRYLLTNAEQSEHGRLDWVLDALEASPSLPDLVVIDDGAIDKAGGLNRPEIEGRVHVVTPREIADMGALIGGAELLVKPQSVTRTGYAVLAALSQGVPTVHAGLDATAELTLDSSRTFSDAAELRVVLDELCTDVDARERLSQLASDRGRTFSWHSTAWHLWELHADL